MFMRSAHSKKKLKNTAFVPRGLFVGALAATSVIPLCACGGTVAAGAGKDAGSDSVIRGVAQVGFDGAVYGVARVGFDGAYGVAVQAFDAGQDSSITFTVAACCFDAGFPDATVGVAVDAFVPDVILGVARVAFDSGPDADSGLVHGVPPVAFDGGK